MGIKELGMTPDEFEAPTLQLLPAVVGELGDQPILAGQDRGGIKSDPLGTQTKLRGMAESPIAVGGLNERLARHTPSQDAEPTDLFAPLDYHRGETERGGGPGGGISPAPPADHREVKFLHSLNVLLHLLFGKRVKSALS